MGIKSRSLFFLVSILLYVVVVKYTMYVLFKGLPEPIEYLQLNIVGRTIKWNTGNT